MPGKIFTVSYASSSSAAPDSFAITAGKSFTRTEENTGGGGSGGGLAKWSFENDLNDSFGAHTLTAVGSTNYTTGQVGQCVQFSGGFDIDTGEANRLESASSDFAFGNTDWLFNFYCRLPSVSGGLKILISRTDTVNLLREWYIVYQSGIGFRLRFFDNSQTEIGSTTFSITATSNTWYQIEAKYTASTQEASIDVNASGTPATGTLTATPIILTGSDVRLCLGGDNINTVASGFRLDEVIVNPAP